MVTEKNLFKEYAICSINELGDEKNQNGRDHVVRLLFYPSVLWVAAVVLLHRSLYSSVLGSHNFMWSYVQCS